MSQPYVVRTFGTKLELFLQVFRRAMDRIRFASKRCWTRASSTRTARTTRPRSGWRTRTCSRDRDLLQIMMHGYSAGGVDEIAELSRECMAEIFRTIRRTGCDEESCRNFIAHGMLINMLLSMHARAPGRVPELDALSECTFGDTLHLAAK